MLSTRSSSISLTPEEILARERRFGRMPGMSRIIDLFDDTKNEKLDIHIVAIEYFPSNLKRIFARSDLHWAIAWYLGTRQSVPCFRLLHVVTETHFTKDNYGREVENKIYTNWGPHTKRLTEETCDSSLWVKIGRLSLERRRELEFIAANEPVQAPNGTWNSQHWVKAVLSKAISAGHFNPRVITNAITMLSVSYR